MKRWVRVTKDQFWNEIDELEDFDTQLAERTGLPPTTFYFNIHDTHPIGRVIEYDPMEFYLWADGH